MKAIIMAAGIGQRISKHINNEPKCLLKIKPEKSLIEYTIESLYKKNITDISLVLGYESHLIENELKKYNIKIYYNYFYEVTNSIASLWFSKNELNDSDDIMILNADLFMHEKLLEEIIKENNEITIYSDESKKKDADYRLYYKDGKLLKHGKDLLESKTTGEEVGIVKIKKDKILIFKKYLEKLIKKGKYSYWWEQVIYDMGTNNIEEIFVKDISGIFWEEIDYFDDYLKIKKHLEKEEQK